MNNFSKPPNSSPIRSSSSRIINNELSSNNNNKQIKIGNYILGTTIGKGNSAVVKLATHCLTKQKVAIKMFDKSGLDSDKQLRLRREIDSMKRLKHHNIIRLFEIMETSKLICLVTEYASYGDLFQFVLQKKRLSEREARFIFKQILTAVHYCHLNQIVHRDIKVENLLLDASLRVKLADFGFSTHFNPGDKLDVWCGSPPYCAPELYHANLYDGPKVDIWSLGVVLYVLVCGYLPFEAQSFSQLKIQVTNGSYKLPFFLSDECKNLIKSILTVDPKKRFSIEDIVNHRWLKLENNINDGCSSDNNNNSNPVETSRVYHDFRNIIDKIELISIKDFKPDKAVLSEVEKYGFNIDEVINSLKNSEFDSNAGLYYLIESKYTSYQSTINSNSSTSTELSSPNPPLTNSSSFKLFSNYNSKQTSNNNLNNVTYGNLEIKLLEISSKQSSQSHLIKKEACQISNFDDLENSINKININNKNNLAFDGDDDYFASEMTTNSYGEHYSDSVDSEILNNQNDDDDEFDNGKCIEELGREYLHRHNSIRRHTIGTNSNAINVNSYIMKSTECLPKLDENEQPKPEQSCFTPTAESSVFNISKIQSINNNSNTNTNSITNYELLKRRKNEKKNYEDLVEENQLLNMKRNKEDDSRNKISVSSYEKTDIFMETTTSNGSNMNDGNSYEYHDKIYDVPYQLFDKHKLKQQIDHHHHQNDLNLLLLNNPESESSTMSDHDVINDYYFYKNNNSSKFQISSNNDHQNSNTTNGSENSPQSELNFNELLQTQNNLGNLKLLSSTNRKHYLIQNQKNNYKNKFRNSPSSSQSSKKSVVNNFGHYLSPNNVIDMNKFGGRRASDGGSNISLFNQFYTLNKVYNNNIFNNNQNQSIISSNSTQRSRGSITSGIPILPSSAPITENNGNNNPSIYTNNNNSNNNDNEIILNKGSFNDNVNINNLLLMKTNNSNSNSNLTDSTSGGGGGSSSFANNSPLLNYLNCLNKVTSLSSEDDDSNHSGANNSSAFNNSCDLNINPASSVIKHQRKSKSRHEPYMDSLSSSNTTLNSSNINANNSSSFNSSSFSSKSREHSFSGTPSSFLSNFLNNPASADFSSLFNNNNHNNSHRASEPNPFDLINANRARLEFIYNQSISNKHHDVPLSKELQMLQLENPLVDEQTQLKWQVQHKNYSLLHCGIDNTNNNYNNNCLNENCRTNSPDKYLTPKSSLSSNTSDDLSPKNSFSININNRNSPSILGNANNATNIINNESAAVLVNSNNFLALENKQHQNSVIKPSLNSNISPNDVINSSSSSLSPSVTANSISNRHLTTSVSETTLSQSPSLTPSVVNTSCISNLSSIENQQSQTSNNMLGPSSILQIIQEEQNEMLPLLSSQSTSTSLSSSTSTTPRLSTSSHVSIPLPPASSAANLLGYSHISTSQNNLNNDNDLEKATMNMSKKHQHNKQQRRKSSFNQQTKSDDAL